MIVIRIKMLDTYYKHTDQFWNKTQATIIDAQQPKNNWVNNCGKL